MVTSITSRPHEPKPSEIPVWQIRLLGAAIGAVVPFLEGLLTLPTLWLPIIAGIGVPVGLVVGALFAPDVVDGKRRTTIILRAGGLAFVLGTTTYSIAAALAEGDGASALDLLAFTFQASLPIALGMGVVSAPMALLTACLSVVLVARLAPRAGRLWLLAAIVGALVVAATVSVAAQVTTGGGRGDIAARLGDQIRFEYLVIDQSGTPYRDPALTLEVRSFWHGEIDGGSSGAIGSCSSGTESIGSDWVIWIGSDQDMTRYDRPPVEPLASSRDFPGERSVRLTIIIAPDGTASWLSGIAGGPCYVMISTVAGLDPSSGPPEPGSS